MTDLTQAIKSMTRFLEPSEPEPGMARNVEVVLLAVIPALPSIAKSLEKIASWLETIAQIEHERNLRELGR